MCGKCGPRGIWRRLNSECRLCSVLEGGYRFKSFEFQAPDKTQTGESSICKECNESFIVSGTLQHVLKSHIKGCISYPVPIPNRVRLYNRVNSMIFTSDGYWLVRNKERMHCPNNCW
jgi:hypothetical protein